MSKKFDSHATDFGIQGNRNGKSLAAYRQAMVDHMTAVDTKIYRFNYRGQGQAVGFINPDTGLMVMLKADGTFWSGWKLGSNQFAGIVDKGFLW
ncbi:colicin D domain-containing protein [Streptacidiphilus monticola]